MEFTNLVIRFFQSGGAFMYPIAIVLAIGIAIAVERWLFLIAAKNSNKRSYDALMPLVQKREYNAVIRKAEELHSPMANIISSGITRRDQLQRRDDITGAMEESVMEALPRLEKRTPYLATLANVATLLGLLGTIIGLIAAFTAVASADPAEKANLLSQSISVAMNTTAFGLIAAIPLLLSHALLQTKTNEIVTSLEMAGMKVINTLTNIGVASSTKQNSKASPSQGQPTTTALPA